MRDALVGRTVDGRYQVVARLARGGMATVYQALDVRLDRTVALKVMHAGLAEDAGFVHRFQQEAKSAARLSDPHVVAVYDQGEADGLVYLAMEFVPGRTVRDVLREHGPLTPEQALTVLAPVLSALQAAHAAGFVHRDVKPENVLISDDGRIKVADFGLARAVSGASSSTTQGLLIGTVAYLSPEQVEHGIADPRSDVYGAGILLYEMLTGAVPFEGDSPLSVAYQHVNTDVPSPARVRPGLPADVDALVVRATRRDPAQRYPDARAFLADVRRVRSHLPSAAPFSADRDTLVVDATDLAELRAASTPAGAPAGTGGRNGSAAPASAVAAAYADPYPVAAPPRRPLPGDEPATTPPAPPAGTATRRRRRHPGRWIAAIVVLLAVAAAAYGGWYVAAGPGRTVAVPGIIGLDAKAAAAKLSAAELSYAAGDTEFSETVPSGDVIRTDPAPGSEVRTGATVTATLSRGPERYAVPNVVGKPVKDAVAALVSGNLRGGAQSQKYDEKVKAGVVLATTPTAGAKVKPDTPVALVVSKGPKPIPLPKMVGRTAGSITDTLQGLGLTVTTTEEYSSSVATGRVISTSPKAGTVLNRGDSVALVVSKGPPPVAVPSLVDLKRGDALAALDRLGLKANIVEGPFTPIDRVITQDPSPGTMLPRGSTVTITII